MAQLAVAGAGAAIGFVVSGFNPVGAQIGWMVGGVAGAVLFPPKGPTIEGPRLSDLNGGQTSAYGVPIPTVAARFRGAGNVIWKTAIEERKNKRRQGKGGGGPTYVEYTYFCSWAVGICEWLIPPTNAGLLRIWLDNKLVYDTSGDSEIVSIPGLTWRFYDGSETQTPDPLIEATVGADRAPAHRGLAYIVFEDVPLEKFGNRIPNVTVEIASEVVDSYPQVNSEPPASTLWPSSPGGYAYIGNWANPVAVDYRRGRIYEGRKRTSGNVGTPADFMIRVYDLITMQTIAEHDVLSIVEDLLPLGTDPVQISASGAILHVAGNGYLYMIGGGATGGTKTSIWKVDPDTWRAVDVFGTGLRADGFGDNAASVLMPMAMTSVQIPSLLGEPRTMIVVQGVYAFAKVIDGDDMTFVWGAADINPASPPVLKGGLSISPLTFPIVLAPGREDVLEGSDLWWLRGSEGGATKQIAVSRLNFTSGVVNLGGNIAGGIARTDYTPIDIAAQVDASATYIMVQSAWWDEGDQTLVITISGAGGPLMSRSRYSTFKWNPETGAVVWSLVNHAGPIKSDGRGSMGRVLGGVWGMAGNMLLQPATGDALRNASGSDFQNLAWLDEQQAVIGFRSSGAGVREIAKRYLTRAAASTLTVGQVVAALCERAGLEVTDYDVSELSDPLRGYVLARPMSARDAITPLAAAFQFDGVEQDDVMVFRKRGSATVATIAYDDMARESPDQSVISEQRAQDLDLPREVTVRYADIERGWEQGAQTWRRPLSPTATMTSRGVAGMDLPMPLTAAEAKTVAQRMCISTWRERTRLQFTVGPAFSRLVPTDTIMVGTRDGAAIRCRIGSIQDGANWTRRLEVVTEDAAVYGLISTAADGGDDWDEPGMPLPYYTRLIVPNLALVTDADDLGQSALREYAFACAYDGARWRSVRLVRSADRSSWTDLGFVTTPVAWGAVVGMPSAPATPWTWDETGELVVRMTDGEPESATALEVLNWANMAALVGPDGETEIIQWRDAADEGGGLFRLTGLLRGRRGTEDQITARRAGDLFLILDESRAGFAAPVSEASALRYYRAVSIYEAVSTAAAAASKTTRGRAEQPYAPAHVSGTRDGSQHLSITWLRRTRVDGEWLDGTGTVPLSEGAEAYEVDVLNGSGAVVRTISGLSTPVAAYLASQQVADFGSTQSSVRVRVYQMSNIVGRGIAAEATL